MSPQRPCPRHGFPVCTGLFHLEDGLQALHSLHDLLATSGPLEHREVQGLWFLLRPLLEDLEHAYQRLREEAAETATPVA